MGGGYNLNEVHAATTSNISVKTNGALSTLKGSGCYTTGESFSLTGKTINNQTFKGWYKKNGSNYTKVSDTIDYKGMANGDVELQPDIEWTIGYNLNGGAVASANPTKYTTFTTDKITLNNPTRVSYIFKGWTGSGYSTPATTVEIPQMSTGNRAYTANWEKGSEWNSDLKLILNIYNYLNYSPLDSIVVEQPDGTYQTKYISSTPYNEWTEIEGVTVYRGKNVYIRKKTAYSGWGFSCDITHDSGNTGKGFPGTGPTLKYTVPSSGISGTSKMAMVIMPAEYTQIQVRFYDGSNYNISNSGRYCTGWVRESNFSKVEF